MSRQERQSLVTRRRAIVLSSAAGLALAVDPLAYGEGFFRAADPRPGFNSLELERLVDTILSNQLSGMQGVRSASWLHLGLALLGGAAAVVQILDFLGIRPSFGRKVGYNEAGGCEANFRREEHKLRAESIEEFTDVKRSPHDREVAYLAGRDKHEGKGVASTQFEGADAVTLEREEPSLVEAAARVMKSNMAVPNDKLARSLAFTDKRVLLRPSPLDRSESVRVKALYAYPGSFIMHLIPHSRPPDHLGVLAIHVPGFSEAENPVMVSLSPRSNHANLS